MSNITGITSSFEKITIKIPPNSLGQGKYYYMCILIGPGNLNVSVVETYVMKDIHPFEFEELFNKGKSKYDYKKFPCKLISFNEIRKEEYDLYISYKNK